MTEQQLDRAYVRPGLEEVDGEGVAQGMRSDRFRQTATLMSTPAAVRHTVPGHVLPWDGTGE